MSVLTLLQAHQAPVLAPGGIDEVKTLAPTLAAQIETLIIGAGLDYDRVFAAAGQPAHPTGSCTQVAVWLDQVFDTDQTFSRRGDDIGCVVRTAVRLGVRIDCCYTETDSGDISEAQHLADQNRFVDLVDTVWCGLIALRAAGSLVTTGGCQAQKVGDVTIDARQGGIVSATLYIEVEHDCG